MLHCKLVQHLTVKFQQMFSVQSWQIFGPLKMCGDTWNRKSRWDNLRQQQSSSRSLRKNGPKLMLTRRCAGMLEFKVELNHDQVQEVHKCVNCVSLIDLLIQRVDLQKFWTVLKTRNLYLTHIEFRRYMKSIPKRLQAIIRVNGEQIHRSDYSHLWKLFSFQN